MLGLLFPPGASCLSFRSVKSIEFQGCKIPRGKIKSDPNPNPRGAGKIVTFPWQVAKIRFQNLGSLFFFPLNVAV